MEESHKNTIFILTANDIGPIHNAIRDRCLTFVFNPIDPYDTERLEMIVDKEQMPEHWKRHLPNLIKFTNGSLRQSIDILDSLPKVGTALEDRIRKEGEFLNKAALNLMSSDYTKLTAYLKQAIESGQGRFYILKRFALSCQVAYGKRRRLVQFHVHLRRVCYDGSAMA